MTPSGSEYVASFPVQPAGTTISYYLEFTDSLGHARSCRPAERRRPSRSTRIRRQVFFSDDFEVASGWMYAQVATQDDWQNQAPGNPTHAYDPPTAFAGTKCWGNDLSAAGFNGNYGNNVNNNLTSPTINCTGQTNVAIVYRRWLTVEDGTLRPCAHPREQQQRHDVHRPCGRTRPAPARSTSSTPPGSSTRSTSRGSPTTRRRSRCASSS